MEQTYIFGHRNPDTDSVMGAISLSYLKNRLGFNTVPAVLSSINLESKYALEYFGVKEPMFLNDIKLKVKDLEYSKNYMVTANTSIYDSYKKMERRDEISQVEITEAKSTLVNGKVKGIITNSEEKRKKNDEKQLDNFCIQC